MPVQLGGIAEEAHPLTALPRGDIPAYMDRIAMNRVLHSLHPYLSLAIETPEIAQPLADFLHSVGGQVLP